MTILHFIENFPTEERCQTHFRLNRERQGITCKHCGGNKHYWLNSKALWQCAACDFRTTLRSGTIMHASNLPVRKWYLAMAFMTATKKGISAKELQRQLNHRRYDTIWSLMHRIRNAMGNRDAMYWPEGKFGFDNSFFLNVRPDGRKLRRGKRENDLPRNCRNDNRLLETDKASNHFPTEHFVKMVVNDSSLFKKKKLLSVNEFNEKIITLTDRSKALLDINDHVQTYFIHDTGKVGEIRDLHWERVALTNAKRVLRGIYHKIKGKYLQLYLDEYSYKLNRKGYGEYLFDRLAVAVAKPCW